jgi:hypothetical protein
MRKERKHFTGVEGCAILRPHLWDQVPVSDLVWGVGVSPKRKSLGALTKVWVPHDVQDLMVDFVRRWREKTEISAGRFIHRLGVQGQQVLRLARALPARR